MTGAPPRPVPDSPDLGALVRRHDPDRYFCALFAAAAGRSTLFTLYAFNHELARACEVTREPGLALIRLQWWREVVEGAARAHEVAAPLHAAVRDGHLDAGLLLAMVEAREAEAEGGFATLEAWQGWLSHGAGALAVAAGQALGAPPAALERLRALGAGYGIAGQLRNIHALAASGRCLLPKDVLADHGLSAQDVIGGRADTLPAVRARLAKVGLATLGPAARIGRAWCAAGLPAVLGRLDLRYPQRPARLRGGVERGRVVAGALAGRC